MRRTIAPLALLIVWNGGGIVSAAAKVILHIEDHIPIRVPWYTDHRRIELHPELQNTPLGGEDPNLRPPPPILPGDGSSPPPLFVGLASFRDGERCGYAVFTGISRAAHPDRLSFGVVDQILPGDPSCRGSYCSLAREEWPGGGDCPRGERLKYVRVDANLSRGPTHGRTLQQGLIGDEVFCLQLDAHSVFTNRWDVELVSDWLRADNEMAVLSAYLWGFQRKGRISPDGENRQPKSVRHLCATSRVKYGMVRNVFTCNIRGTSRPQMSALWGAGMSFSKCHAERRAPVDPHTPWLFNGEEFLRASHLWTSGYDMYTPSWRGHVVYHNYSKVPMWFERLPIDKEQRLREKAMSANRVHLITNTTFEGEVDATEMDKYGYRNVRSLDSYLRFAGINLTTGKDTYSCKQLHWVPYENPEEVEKLLGWKMRKDEEAQELDTEQLRLRSARHEQLLKEEAKEELALMEVDENVMGGLFLLSIIVFILWGCYARVSLRRNSKSR